jgi:hypothetical protein
MPVNDRGAIPTMVAATPLSQICRPTTDGSAARRRAQNP